MKSLKYILTCSLIFGSFIISQWLAGIIPPTHWGYAISITFLFIITFTIIFDMLISPLVINSCYRIEGSIYHWLGVRYYGYMLRFLGWEKVVRKDQPLNHNLASLAKFEAWTKGSEAIHLFAAISVFVSAIWIGYRHSIRDIRWLFLSNILFNVYPVMLQRHNRARVTRLLDHGKRHSRKR